MFNLFNNRTVMDKMMIRQHNFSLLDERKYRAAIREFQKELLAGAPPLQAESPPGRGGALIYYGLGQAFQGLNEGEKAVEHYLEAVRLSPSFRPPYYPLAGLLKVRYRNMGQVTAFLETRLSLVSRGELALLAEICSYLQEDRLALLYLTMFREQGGVLEGELKPLYASCLLGSGKFQQAGEVLAELNCRGGRNNAAAERGQGEQYLDYCLACWLSPGPDTRKQGAVTAQTRRENELGSFLEEMYLQQNLYPDRKEFILAFIERSLRYQRLELSRAASELLPAENLLDRGEGYLRTGELYYLYGFEGEAARQLNRFLEEGLENERVYYYLGLLREKEGRLPEAEEYCRQALRLNKGAGIYRQTAARIALKRVEKVGRQILSALPDYIVDGGSASLAEQLRVIRFCIKRLVSQTAADWEVHKGGRCCRLKVVGQEEGSPERRSAVELRTWPEEFIEALEALEALQGVSRKEGWKQGQQERLEERILFYHKGALEWIKSGRYRQGLEFLEEGIKYFPDSPNLWFLKGELCFLKKQYVEARRALRRSLALPAYPGKYPVIDGQGFLACQALGRLEEEEGEEERAVYYYLKTLNYNKDYRPAREGVRRIYRRQRSRVIEYLDPDLKEHSGVQREANQEEHLRLIREWLKGVSKGLEPE